MTLIPLRVVVAIPSCGLLPWWGSMCWLVGNPEIIQYLCLCPGNLLSRS